MGQFPSSILGGCECGGGDLAILDSAGRLTLLWILLAPPDLQNLTKWKAFLEVSHLRFLALFRIQLRDLESLDSVFCDLVWSAREATATPCDARPMPRSRERHRRSDQRG